MTNQTKNSASLANQSQGGLTLFGDLPLNDSRIVNLTYDDPVPGTNKTLGEMEYDDFINTNTVTNQTKHSA